ncbi:hypothetical protein EBZ38_07310 [bacterium]|nr:hypothetical protein [bacterium]
MVQLYIWIAIGTYLFTDYDFYKAELQTFKIKLIRAAIWPIYLGILLIKVLVEILILLYADSVLWFRKEDKNVHTGTNGSSEVPAISV